MSVECLVSLELHRMQRPMCARYGNEESTLQTRAERTYFNACPIQSVLPSPLSVHIEYRSHSLAVHV